MKFTTKIFLGWASVIGLVAAAQDASAQYAGSMGRMYNTISFASQSLSISQNSYYDTLHRGQKLGSGSASSSNSPSNSAPSNPGRTTYQPPPPQQYPITATDFVPSPNRIVPDQMVNDMPNLTPEQKESLRNTFIQTLAVFESRIRKNNLASSFAYIVATSEQIVDQRQVTVEETTSMVNYYNNVLASSPQFRNYSATQKQTLNEALLLTSASMEALYTKGLMEKNPALQNQARDMAKSYLKSLAGRNVQ